MTAEYFIEKLELQEHIEGGYFKEVYRCADTVNSDFVSADYEDPRALATTIYFLLKSGQTSKFHRLRFDEIWFYHYGSPIRIHMIDPEGKYSSHVLGLDVDKNQSPQILIPANTLFGAEPMESNSFGLVSCMVTPGFDFRDFELFSTDALCARHPDFIDVIRRINKELV
jgi:hypothetical protein